MVQFSFRTALVAAISTTELGAPGLHAASGAAITLSAIAAHANPEHRLASATDPFPESDLAWNRHAATAALDNGPDLWEGKTSFDWRPVSVATGTPLLTQRGSTPTFRLIIPLRPPGPSQRKKNIPCGNNELQPIQSILYISRITFTTLENKLRAPDSKRLNPIPNTHPPPGFSRLPCYPRIGS